MQLHDSLIAAALNDPARNLFGKYGPKHGPCSGMGRVFQLPQHRVRPSGMVEVFGRATRDPSPCVCPHVAGVDSDPSRRQLWALGERIARYDRQAIEAAKRQAGLFQWMRGGPEILNSMQSWQELLAYATADGTAVHTTTDETILFPNVTLPANYMQNGRVLRLTAAGKLSTTGTPTMTFALRWGGVSGTLLATTEALTNGSGVANVNWKLEIVIQTRANGATGSLLVFGDAHLHTASGTVLQNIFSVSGFDAPAAVTVDLTADTALSLTGDWSASSASNTITGMLYLLESLN